MNIVIVMSGGIGARFGAAIPKQYNLIDGRPVIDYVLDAVEAAQTVDRIVIVMDEQWINYSEKVKKGQYDIAPNGTSRIESMYNGLKLIKERYACDKVIIVDAVAPFIYGQLIDDYFEKLDQYDAVITSQKITGGFTDIHDSRLKRDEYIITQSPEGFRFELLWNNYDLNFSYEETAGMLPDGSRRFYNFDFKNNLKLTYDFDLLYCEFMLRSLGKANREKNVAFFDKSILITEGIKSYLLRREREKTLRFIDDVYSSFPQLISRWEITSFLPNQLSRFGLVFQAKSRKYGGVVLKFIPDFVGRFDRELEAMRLLPESYMCKLIDADESCNCMLLEKIEPARFASFEENLKLTNFFKNVVSDAVAFEGQKLEFIPSYFEELKEKYDQVDLCPYCRDQVKRELEYAIELYNHEFADADLYILHGDLHEKNILDNGQRFYGIDPNGMLAPLELECVRFIRNDVRSHSEFGFAERFRMLLYNFGRFVNMDRLVSMFIIDMAFCTFNSTFENDDPRETYDNLELISIAKKWREKS